MDWELKANNGRYVKAKSHTFVFRTLSNVLSIASVKYRNLFPGDFALNFFDDLINLGYPRKSIFYERRHIIAKRYF